MKDYCSRARAALNLILLLTLVQVWVLFSVPNSPESIDRDLDAIYRILGPYIGQPDNPDLPTAREPLNKLVEKLNNPEFVKRDDVILATFDMPFNPELDRSFYWTIIDQIDAAWKKQHPKDDPQDHPPDVDPGKVSKAANAAVAAIAHIKKLTKRSGLPLTSNIGQLKHYYSKDIELPVLKQSIEPDDVFLVLQVATAFPLLILLVLLDSMTLILKKMREDGESIEPLDCIFFYRSLLAVPVSVIWLVAPFVLMAIQSWHFNTYEEIEETIAVRVVFWSFLLLIPANLFFASMARISYLALSNSKKMSEVPRVAPTAEESEGDAQEDDDDDEA